MCCTIYQNEFPWLPSVVLQMSKGLVCRRLSYESLITLPCPPSCTVWISCEGFSIECEGFCFQQNVIFIFDDFTGEISKDIDNSTHYNPNRWCCWLWIFRLFPKSINPSPSRHFLLLATRTPSCGLDGAVGDDAYLLRLFVTFNN